MAESSIAFQNHQYDSDLGSPHCTLCQTLYPPRTDSNVIVTVLFVILAIIGTLLFYFLFYRKYGVNPQQKEDSLLAEYSAMDTAPVIGYIENIIHE